MKSAGFHMKSAGFHEICQISREIHRISWNLADFERPIARNGNAYVSFPDVILWILEADTNKLWLMFFISKLAPHSHLTLISWQIITVLEVVLKDNTSFNGSVNAWWSLMCHPASSHILCYQFYTSVQWDCDLVIHWPMPLNCPGLNLNAAGTLTITPQVPLHMR